MLAGVHQPDLPGATAVVAVVLPRNGPAALLQGAELRRAAARHQRHARQVLSLADLVRDGSDLHGDGEGDDVGPPEPLRPQPLGVLGGLPAGYQPLLDVVVAERHQRFPRAGRHRRRPLHHARLPRSQTARSTFVPSPSLAGQPGRPRRPAEAQHRGRAVGRRLHRLPGGRRCRRARLHRARRRGVLPAEAQLQPSRRLRALALEPEVRRIFGKPARRQRRPLDKGHVLELALVPHTAGGRALPLD